MGDAFTDSSRASHTEAATGLQRLVICILRAASLALVAQLILITGESPMQRRLEGRFSGLISDL
jgi:hypothetical protein